MNIKQFHFSVLLCWVNITAAAAPKCIKDACWQTVKRQNKPGGFGACTTFFATTIIPSPVYTTTALSTISIPCEGAATRTSVTSASTTETSVRTITTTTVASTTTYVKRDEAPTTKTATLVPKYARAQCTDTVQYSSACSCLNVQHTTITASTRTITESVAVNNPSVVCSYSTTTTEISTWQSTSTVKTTTTATVAIPLVTQQPAACNASEPAFWLRVKTADNPKYVGWWWADIFQTTTVPYSSKPYLDWLAGDTHQRYRRYSSCALITEFYSYSTDSGQYFAVSDDAWSNITGFRGGRGISGGRGVRLGFNADGEAFVYHKTPPFDQTILQIPETGKIDVLALGSYVKEGYSAFTLERVYPPGGS